MSVKPSDTKQFVVKAAIVFVVIVLGIVVGVAISVKTGLTERLKGGSTAAELPNRTALNTGDSLPSFEVFDQNGQAVPIEQLASGQRMLIAFVSNGCGPCHTLVEHLQGLNGQDGFDYGVLLLSLSPEFFIENHNLPTFRIEQSVMDEYDIHVMPTIITVDENGLLQSIASGYMKRVLEKIIEDDA